MVQQKIVLRTRVLSGPYHSKMQLNKIDANLGVLICSPSLLRHFIEFLLYGMNSNRTLAKQAKSRKKG
jgi:hypothetical protein